MAAEAREVVFGFRTGGQGQGEHVLTIRQTPSKSVAWKIYPGAFFLCGYLESHAEELALQGKVVVELGAGVCGIPSLFLAKHGAHAVATDLPDVLPDLQRNVDANPAANGGSCATMPLAWGDKQAAADLLAAVDAAHGPPALFVAAEVVYWEHLIEPLLDTLEALTHDRHVRVVMSYVQRFKRAKRFFKRAQRRFKVTAIAVADVVDYEALTWGPRGAFVPVDGAPRIFTSNSAQYDVYMDGLERPAADEQDDDHEHDAPLDGDDEGDRGDKGDSTATHSNVGLVPMRAYIYIFDRL